MPRMAAFQSTHPRRVRLSPLWAKRSMASFQSTHPRRVRPAAGLGWHLIESVSIHAPTQVRREWCQPALVRAWFQSTHPRRVRRPAFQVPILAGDVSIHAPTQGATTGALARASTPDSIHAPTQGATTSPNGRRRSTQRFNPRTHAGCDHRPPRVAIAAVAANPRTHAGCDLRVSRLYAIEGVSIHAPTQGATISRSYSVLNLLFQSTHPRRVRHFLGWFPNRSRSFNPRTHAGVRRLLGGRQVRVHRVSIHAPTQGATSSTCGSHRSESSFNPRTHAGCDSAVRPVFRVGDVVSIHAPTQGATLRR